MIRRYEDSDYETVEAWGRDWGASYSKDLLPPVGFIVPDMAAFFLYETPSKVCFIENLISNKNADPVEVDKAVTLLMDTLIVHAKEMGFEVAYACTNNASVVKRALKADITVSPNYVLLQKKL
jgi:hypothetical protein